MLTTETIKAYNAIRSTRDKSVLCHAPFTNLNFEQNGNVTACCYNRQHILGQYPHNNLLDIWFGEKANALRGYIRENNLGGGCQLCEAQLQSGNFHNSRAKGFDLTADWKITQHLKKIDSYIRRKEYMQMPTSLEFEISNTCNLECVMCSGYFSSSIRKNREHLPALPNPYDENFVHQVIPFIPYLKEARFLGGEPFLIDIYYSIWDAIATINPKMRVSITSNGTVLNQRAKNLLQKLNCSIIISLDSIQKETYEAIRLNAKFGRVWENFEYLYQYTRQKNRYMSFAVCPMTLNWHEIPSIVAFCNQKDIYVHFNTVIQPEAYAMENMPLHTLAQVRELYNNSNPLANSFIGHYNNKVFADLVNHVEAWYARSLAVESEPTQQENIEVANLLLQLPANNTQDDTKVLTEYVRHQLRTSKENANAEIEGKRLSYRLTQLLSGMEAKNFIASVQQGVYWFSMHQAGQEHATRLAEKLGVLIAEVATNNKTEILANKLSNVPPDQIIAVLDAQPVEQLLKLVKDN